MLVPTLAVDTLVGNATSIEEGQMANKDVPFEFTQHFQNLENNFFNITAKHC